MMEVREKKVELIELFYDLIFVYAMSNLTLLIEEPEGGILTWEMFSIYIIFSMVVIQAWFLMTVYVNHCCQWWWYEYVLVILNMSAAVLITQTINNDPDTSSIPSLSSMAFMVACVIALYLIEYKKNDQHAGFAKHNLIKLSLIEVVYIIAIGLRVSRFEEITKFIIVINLFIGMLLPLLKNAGDEAQSGNFPHLIEDWSFLPSSCSVRL